MRCTAGEIVGPGFYWSPTTGEQCEVADEEQILAGEPGTTYIRLPRSAMLVLAPLLGGLFVMFLPVIGIVLTLNHLGALVGRRIGKLASAIAPVAVPSEMIGQAALTRKDEDEEEADDDVEIEDRELLDEIKARRDKGDK